MTSPSLVAELTRDAAAAGTVEVLQVKSFEYKRIPFTLVSARVITAAKGSITEGSDITIVYDGPAMQPGQRHIVFLRPNTIPAVGAEFVVVGGLMGDFPVSPDGTIRPDARVDTSDPALRVLRSVSGRSAADVIREIRSMR